MKKIEIIKKGDRVKVTTDGNILNKFTSRYAGKEAVVTELCSVNHRQVVKLDIDGGLWKWEFDDKPQISKIS